MAKLKKAKSSKKLSFSDVGLEPKPIFELDNLNYNQKREKNKKNLADFDNNEDETSEKEVKLMTKSELKKIEKKRKSLNKNKNKLGQQPIPTENDEFKIINKFPVDIPTKIDSNNSYKGLKNSFKIVNEDKEIKSNSYLSFEDSFKSISEFNNSSFNTDSNEGSSLDHEEFSDKVEANHTEIEDNDTYENFFNEILDDKVKKEEMLSASKKTNHLNQAEKEIQENDQKFSQDITEMLKNDVQDYNGDTIKITNSSLDDMNLSTKKEDSQDSIQIVSQSETTSPKKFSKRKMLYSFANSVWDYVKPVSLDDLEKKQNESKKTEIQTNHHEIQQDENLQNHIEHNNSTHEIINSTTEFNENTNENKIHNSDEHNEKVELDQVEIIKRSKSQEIISHLNDYNQINNQGIPSNCIPKISNSHNSSLVSTPKRKSKRQMIYSFANSIWDYVKPVSLDELEERKKTNEFNINSTQSAAELKNDSFFNDEVSDSEFYIKDSEEEEDNGEEKKEIVQETINEYGNLEEEQKQTEKEEIGNINQFPIDIHQEETKEICQEQIPIPLETIVKQEEPKEIIEKVEEEKEGKILEKEEEEKTTKIEEKVQKEPSLQKEKSEEKKQDQTNVSEPPEDPVGKNQIPESIVLVDETCHTTQVVKENDDIPIPLIEDRKNERNEENKQAQINIINPEIETDPINSKLQIDPVEKEQTKENKEDKQNHLNIVNDSNFKNQGVNLDQTNVDSNHLEKILQDIAADSNTVMHELSQISIGKNENKNLIQIPDLSEISSIQEMIDSNGLVISQNKEEKYIENKTFDSEHENQSSIKNPLTDNVIHPTIQDKEVHFSHQNHFDSAQRMVERMEDEILNTNLDIDEYDELFNNLNIHGNFKGDEYNMSNLDTNLLSFSAKNQNEERNNPEIKQLQDLHKAHQHLYQQVSIQEIDDSIFMSISSDQFLFENTMLISEKQVSDHQGLGYSFRALKCCSEPRNSNECSDLEFKVAKTHHHKVNKSKLFNKLYRLENKVHRKVLEISKRVNLLNQEREEKKSNIAINKNVTLINIESEPGFIFIKEKLINKEKELVVKEEILPSEKNNNSKTLLDTSVNTDTIQKTNYYQEKGINTNLDGVEETQSKSLDIKKTDNFEEKDKKVDSIFRNEIYKILDNTKLVKKAQRLKSGYANTDQDDKEANNNIKNISNSNLRYNRERYAKPGNNRYDVITQSSRYIKDYPESSSDDSVQEFSPKTKVVNKIFPKSNETFQGKNIKKDGRNSQILMGNIQNSHVSPRSLSPTNNNNYYSYYLRNNSPSPNIPNTQAFNSNNNVNSSSYYYNGGNTQIRYPEYKIQPNRYLDELGGSNYHVNYYCGRSGGFEEVRRYIYVDGFTNKNQGSYYFCPPGQARS
ncbi:uncharacterized protein cubi_01912 [Cryptosporidium ubiquitum]|uniref:Uncharacterized protein n=1 Tax=Cryptosporidium ubiquitum TaxID=857276 RepID=A0A1J4MMW7_9CRYT|nr:uncharacterized protein cubi_01912 [Cryptosporidium ubiquitum]OII75391.1 hypothetical protein cubi_01912 [Cryptosporidium ubiquitum]